MPVADPSTPDLLTCSDIAARIARTRGSCNRASVWRAIQRLKITAKMTVGKFSFYTEGDADQIASSMRKHKATATESEATAE